MDEDPEPQRDPDLDADEGLDADEDDDLDPREGLDADEDDDLDPREAARVRRRDHEAEAERRALMRPGMGKVFKQILDRQARDAGEPAPRHRHHRA